MSKKSTQFYVLLPLLLALVIDSLGMGLIFPVLSVLFSSTAGSIVSSNTSDFWRTCLYGLTMSSFSLAMFLAAPLLGDISDRYGRKKVLIICLIGNGFGFFVSAFGIFYHSISLVIIGRAIGGFTAGNQPLAQAAIIDISVPAEKAINMTLISLAGALGFVVGPIIGGYFSNHVLVSWFSFTTPFVIAGFMALLNALGLLLLFKETWQPKDSLEKLSLVKGLGLFYDAITDKTLRTLAVIFLCFETGWSLYFQYISLFLVEKYHYTALQVGWLLTCVAIVFSATLLVGMRLLLHFFELKNIMRVGVCLCAFGLSALCLFNTEAMQWLMVLPIHIGLALAYSAILTLFSDAVEPARQGWAMGVSWSVVSVSFLLSGLACGLLAGIGLTIPFWMAAILVILAVIIIFQNK